MASIHLDPVPRRAWLTSFGVASGFLSGAGICAVAWWTGSPSAFLAGALAFLVPSLVGAVLPQTMIIPYRGFAKLARIYAGAARKWIICACYLVVLTAVGGLGSSLDLREGRTRNSLWARRSTLSAATYASQHHSQRGRSSGGWIRTFTSWTVRSGNLWALSILPFLVMLAALEFEEHRDVPSDIYTLF